MHAGAVVRVKIPRIDDLRYGGEQRGVFVDEVLVYQSGQQMTCPRRTVPDVVVFDGGRHVWIGIANLRHHLTELNVPRVALANGVAQPAFGFQCQHLLFGTVEGWPLRGCWETAVGEI